MTDRVVDTIAEAIAESAGIYFLLLTPEEAEYYLNAAKASLAALKRDRIAVTELPRAAVGVNGQDNRVWLRAPYIEQEFSGDVVISDRVGIDRGELRDVAAALLAAADAAEEEQ